MTCKECLFEDLFWNSIDREKEILIIREFYAHKLKIDCFDRVLKLCSQDSNIIASIILEILDKYTCTEIINIITNNYQAFQIKASDIPQFSDLDDCIFKVPYILLNSGLDCISYEKMGYYLRNKPRSIVADRKYGENHIKTTEQLGLCSIRINHMACSTAFTKAFYHLEKEKQKRLVPKLCLYIPIIQNYFIQGCSTELIEKSLSILSESTITRRRPNINTLIETVTRAINRDI